MSGVAVCWLLVLASILAFGWPRRRRSAVVDVEYLRPPVPDTLETRVAVHEVGHLLAAWSCTFVHCIRKTTVDSEGGRDGHVAYDVRLNPKGQELWCLAVIAMAGRAAEDMVFGNGGRGSSSDLEKAVEWMMAVDRDRAAILVASAYTLAKCLLRSYGLKFDLVVVALLTHHTLKEHDVERILGPRVGVRMLGLFRTEFVLPR